MTPILCYITIIFSLFTIMFSSNLRRLKRLSNVIGFDITGAIRIHISDMILYSVIIGSIIVLSLAHSRGVLLYVYQA